MKITMKAVAVTGLTSGALLLAPAGMAFADSPGSGAPGAPAGMAFADSPGSGAPGAPTVSIPTSVANSTSVSDNLLGPWLGLIGNSLNGSLNNSLNNSLNGAQVVANVGVLSPPFTLLSVTTIIYNDNTPG